MRLLYSRTSCEIQRIDRSRELRICRLYSELPSPALPGSDTVCTFPPCAPEELYVSVNEHIPFAFRRACHLRGSLPSLLHFTPPEQSQLQPTHIRTVNLTMSQSRTQWLIYAGASGACAALNGVFAKLTTTQLTTTWATGTSHLFGFSEPSKFIEFIVRGVCFFLGKARTTQCQQC